jgi:hypothetical protein
MTRITQKKADQVVQVDDRGAGKKKGFVDSLPSIGSVNGPRTFTLEDRFKPSGARPPALDKFAAAFSIAGERQQKAAGEEIGALLEHFSADPDV